MKVSNVSQATQYALEMKRLQEQAIVKERELKQIRNRQQELEKLRSNDPTKGQNVDKLA